MSHAMHHTLPTFTCPVPENRSTHDHLGAMGTSVFQSLQQDQLGAIFACSPAQIKYLVRGSKRQIKMPSFGMSAASIDSTRDSAASAVGHLKQTNLREHPLEKLEPCNSALRELQTRKDQQDEATLHHQ